MKGVYNMFKCLLIRGVFCLYKIPHIIIITTLYYAILYYKTMSDRQLYGQVSSFVILWQMNHVSYLELIQSAEFAFYSFSL